MAEGVRDVPIAHVGALAGQRLTPIDALRRDGRLSIFGKRGVSRYICSTTSIPSSSNPRRIVRAVRSHNNSRPRRSSSESAFSTGHCS